MRIFILLIVILWGTARSDSYAQTHQYLNDEAQQLLSNIATQAGSGNVMFGVANGVSRGYNDLKAQSPDGADCKQITGKNPQFVENDFLFRHDRLFWNNEVQKTKQAQKEGCVIGYCWHLGDLYTNDFRINDKNNNIVSKILSDKDTKEKKWFFALVDTLLTPVFIDLEFPVIFRPFHEMNGHWFWWGSKGCTPDQYIRLYRALVDRLRKNGIRNVIYCWSPDTRFAEEYYPGDDYVDIVGLDVYEPGCSPYHGNQVYTEEMERMIIWSRLHQKIPAITETGLREYEGVMRYPMEIPDFWTSKVFGKILDKKGRGNGIAYVMSWYNANWSGNNRGSLYIPYVGMEQNYGDKGRQAIDDFRKLSKYKHVIFGGDKRYYKKNQK